MRYVPLTAVLRLVPVLGLCLGGRAAAEPAQAPAAAPKGQRVYVCGHSFHVMIAEPLREMAASAGITDHATAGVAMLGGSSVTQHWKVPDEKSALKAALRAGEVDVLTLSPNQQMPDDAIEKFTFLLLQNNPEGRVLVQLSWYPFDAPLGVRGKVSRNEDRDAAKPDDLRRVLAPLHAVLSKQLQIANAVLGVRYRRQVLYLVPVGPAVVALREKVVQKQVPGIKRQSELFADPIGHGKAPIAALAAYCHFAVLYGRSPVGLPMPTILKNAKNATYGEDLNRLLQQVAWDAVLQEPLAGVKNAKP